MNFLTLVTSMYVLAEEKETYWTCFAFEDETPDALHCTHKYFGEQDEKTADVIVSIIDAYFEKSPFKTINTLFNKEEFFGEDKDVRVLSLSNAKDKTKLHLDLKSKLDEFNEDRFPDYKPHVTTDLPKVDKPLTRYCFCLGDKILKEWRE